MKNQVQLITYVDRLGGGGLDVLRRLLQGQLSGAFGAVHVLPFYALIDGADAGFDPIDHTQVDPRLGDWSSIKQLAAQLDVMADVIVNHMSDRSPQYLDWQKNGKASRYQGLFLTRDAVFPDGISERELAAIYRPRPGAPFTEVTLPTGEKQWLWTTFTPHQIDIDVRHPEGGAYLAGILATLAANGVSMVRLDAVGYAIKQPGTSCFMIPATFDFISQFARRGKELGIQVLVEVHAYHQRQVEIARLVDWVYDFALPPLILHAFAFGTAQYLKSWILIRPNNAITVLDTHDGIGIVDIGADAADRAGRPGLVPPEEIDVLVERIHFASHGQSRQATGAAANNLDLYQVNCTFFDALARDERRYLLARAIQFFLPGVPQVYYVGLLAGCNDMALLARTGTGRDINRHYYSLAEIDTALAMPVVRDLLRLIQLRNTHAAFAGRFRMLDAAPDQLALRWEQGTDYAELTIDFKSADYTLLHSTAEGPQRFSFT